MSAIDSRSKKEILFDREREAKVIEEEKLAHPSKSHKIENGVSALKRALDKM